MAQDRNEKPSVATYGDHEIITPPNKLRPMRRARTESSRAKRVGSPFIASSYQASACCQGTIRG